jgi:hypothetical protein
MAIVDKMDKIYSLRVTGKFGDSKSKIYSKFNGIYQRRHRGKNIILVKEKIYRPTNPQTETQQAWRDVFANGVEAWQLLTTSEKSVYNKLAINYNMLGFNLFIRNWLKYHVAQPVESHALFGEFTLGTSILGNDPAPDNLGILGNFSLGSSVLGYEL